MRDVVNQIIIDRGLCSYMNDTKWRELQASIEGLSFPPPYKVKWLDDESVSVEFDEDVSYLGDWSDEAFCRWGNYFLIEWIRVRPRRLVHRGRLVAPEVVDESVEFEDILLRHNIPFEKDGAVYTIWGYK